MVYLSLIKQGQAGLECEQGQARGYGHITLDSFLPSPKVGHDFHKVTVTQQVGQFEIPGCQMKDMNFFFPQIRFAVGQVVWSQLIVKVE